MIAEIFVGLYLAFIAILFTLALLLSGGPDQADINAACANHGGGVMSYQDHSWGATNGTGTAICADMTAVEVED
jgi:hypothetical protein